MNNRPKAVYDTGIVLQGTLHPAGIAGQCLRLLQQNAVEGFVSGRLREEYAEVLSRPVIRAKNSALTDQRAQTVMLWLDEHLTLVFNPTPVIEYPRDPKDEPVINLALTVHADYIVTRDRDLLDLDRSREFRLLFPFLRVFDPVEFVRKIERSTPAGERTDT